MVTGLVSDSKLPPEEYGALFLAPVRREGRGQRCIRGNKPIDGERLHANGQILDPRLTSSLKAVISAISRSCELCKSRQYGGKDKEQGALHDFAPQM